MNTEDLVKETNKASFNPEVISPGFFLRFRRMGETHFRSGVVIKVTPEKLLVVYANVASGATSRMELFPQDVMIGKWELLWTTDLKEIFHIVAKGENP